MPTCMQGLCVELSCSHPAPYKNRHKAEGKGKMLPSHSGNENIYDQPTPLPLAKPSSFSSAFVQYTLRSQSRFLVTIQLATDLCPHFTTTSFHLWDLKIQGLISDL